MVSTVELQVLDVDYILVDEKPIIRVFGKTENNETVCGFYKNYSPYFYVIGKVEELVRNEPQVAKIEKVKRCLPIGLQEPREVYKITLKNPAKTPELREKLKAKGIECYEADILFKYRWMNDFGVKGLNWVSVEGNEVSTDTVSSNKKIQISKIRTMKKDVDVEFKYLALDIETASKENAIPDSKKDPIILVSLVFYPNYKGKQSIILSTRSGEDVTVFSDEKELLQKFMQIINDYDPDFLTGYNINNFDLPYILERVRQNKLPPLLGRCDKYVSARKLMYRYNISITGRVVIDSYEIIKNDWSLKRYGLDFVAKELLGEEKIDVKHSEINRLWNGDRKEFKKLINYCRKDAELALNLVLKLNLLYKYFALSKISGSLLQDILNGGETQRIENFLLQEFNKEGYILPCKPDEKEVRIRGLREKKELKGGFVLEPVKGLQSSIIVLDFKAMYPSLIRTYNICPTTLLSKARENCIKTPFGTCFASKKVRYGIVPRILEKLMRERQEVKEKLKKTSSKEKKRLLNARQWALKIMANAFYGHFGYSRARIYNLGIANAITSLGRNIIQETTNDIEKNFGYEVVYGDTDSVLVKVPTDNLSELSKIGNEIANHITKQLPGILELEFEKIFKRFLALTKKRYMAWCFKSSEEGWEESIEMKGIETIRRDWCELTSEAMMKVIEIILKHNDVKGAVQYFKEIIKDLLEGKIPTSKLVITKTLTKRPESYAGVQPHTEVVKKIKQRNNIEAPGVGDRIGYVIVKGTQLVSKRAEDPVYVIERGLKIDPQYYIENQLLSPLERIFTALGIDKGELLGAGKQIGIFEAVENHKVKMIKELRIQEVDGFICDKCNRFYRRPLLIGKCECGGNFLFSSSKGPVEWVTT